MELTWISFKDALSETEARTRHLLLGSGFSSSLAEGLGYGRLYDVASAIEPAIAPLFTGCGVNFEKAMANASPDGKDLIRATLFKAIARMHPPNSYLGVGQKEHCVQFLEHFAGRRRRPLVGTVFTTNYDFLILWVLMYDKKLVAAARFSRLELYDGFDQDCLWGVERIGQSRLFYLHGALHHYETTHLGKTALAKLRWNKHQSLLDQVKGIPAGQLPIFISEGSSEEKRFSINRHKYLKRVGIEFTRKCADPQSAIFTFGHSLDEVDQHITDSIGDGNGSVYLGVFRPADPDGSKARKMVEGWIERRGGDLPPIKLFNSEECPVWKSVAPGGAQKA